MLQNNNRNYKFMGVKHRREILNGNAEVPEGYYIINTLKYPCSLYA